jgi:hypothetical protein
LLLEKVEMEIGWWAVIFVVNNGLIHWTKKFSPFTSLWTIPFSV